MLDELSSYYAMKFVAIEARRIRSRVRTESRTAGEPSLELIRAEIGALEAKLSLISARLAPETSDVKS